MAKNWISGWWQKSRKAVITILVIFFLLAVGWIAQGYPFREALALMLGAIAFVAVFILGLSYLLRNNP